MNFNATLIGQIVSFGVFWFFCWKFVWPLIINKLEERKTRIADGLAAGEKGVHQLEMAEKRARQILHDGKEQSQGLIVQAQKRHDEIVEEAKDDARLEGDRILAAKRAELEQERQQAREELRREVARLAMVAAEQILMREVDEAAHKDVLDKFSAGL